MLLYKYLSQERIDILESQTVRFTQPKYLNDPFENQITIKSIASNEYLDKNALRMFEENLTDECIKKMAYKSGLEVSDKVIQWLKSELRKQFSLDGFKKLVRSAEPIILPTLMKKTSEVICKTIGIFSLSECYDNLLMWAHYANSHNGFVIGFDINDSSFNNKVTGADGVGILRKVDYCIDKPQLVCSDPEVEDLFFSKSVDWAYEKEWRVVRSLEDADIIKDELYLFKFPLDSVKEVYLGANTDENVKMKIIDIVRNKYCNVRIFESSVDNEKYKLNFTEISP